MGSPAAKPGTRSRRSLRLRLVIATAALIIGSVCISLAAVYFWTSRATQRSVDQSIQSELDDLLAGYSNGGTERLEGKLSSRMEGGEGGRDFFYLYSESSRTVSGNMLRPEALGEGDGFGDFVVEERQVRAARVFLGDGRDLVVARDVSSAQLRKDEFLLAGLAVAAIAAVLAIGAALALSHHLLDRVAQMNRTIVSILGGRREERVPETGQFDEFEEVARHFNMLLDENEQLVDRMRGVTDDIAHDLRTPLARLRGRVEQALASSSDSDGHVRALEDVLSDSNALLETFSGLLKLSKIESGTIREAMAPVDLAAIARDAAELYGPFAEEAGVDLQVAGLPDMIIDGNRHLLSQALTNLIDNAIKFAPAGSQVGVEVRPVGDRICLSVSDSGPGVPSQDYDRIVQRFVRLDASRREPGTGLGLSLVAAVAKLHGAKLVFGDNSPGLLVSFDFPVSGAP